MVAESHLTNPALFQGFVDFGYIFLLYLNSSIESWSSEIAGENPSVYEIVKEYISYVNIYPCPISFVRSHLFKLWVHALKVSLLWLSSQIGWNGEANIPLPWLRRSSRFHAFVELPFSYRYIRNIKKFWEGLTQWMKWWESMKSCE